jgi:V/A-type H+-transporting ATPase subunit C
MDAPGPATAPPAKPKGITESIKGLLQNREITYGYACTRVKARKARILQRPFFEDLLNQRTLDGITAMLERTYYKELLSRLSASYSGSELLEMVAEVHYRDVVNKVRGFSPSDSKPAITLLMRKWDIMNLRTIISAKVSGKAWEAIRPYLVPAGELTPAQLKKLAECEPEKLYSRLRATSVGRELLAQSSRRLQGSGGGLEQMFSKALKDAHTLTQLKILLDASYYNYLQEGIVSSDKDAQLIRSLVAKEIDLRNIINTLRLKRSGASEVSRVEPHLITGGRVTKRTVEALLKTKSNEEVVSAIRPAFRLEAGAYSSLSELEAALEHSLAREKVRIFYRSPISLSTLVGFLMIKEEEMNNLRKIVRGKDYRLTPEEIRPMLVYY